MTTTGKPGTAVTLLEKFSAPLGLSPEYFKQVVKATVLKTKDRPATDEELAMFLAIADRYGLDVWTKQIHGFVDKGAIVPIVGIDGWNHLETHHPDGKPREDFLGEEVTASDNMVQIDKDAKPCPEWMEVSIHIKGRQVPAVHREYLDECYVPPRNGYKGPWQSHTKRMLRHKARIQGIREAFGFGGIYDEDEAQRIIEGGTADYEGTAVEEETGQIIGQDEYDALLAEMKRVDISEVEVKKNLAAKAKYTGELAGMPHVVWESLMAGLATMPTKQQAPPATVDPVTGEVNDDDIGFTDDAPHTAEASREPQGGVETLNITTDAESGPIASDGTMPGRGALFATDDPKRPATTGDKKLLSEALAHVDGAAVKEYRKRFGGRGNSELTHGEAAEFKAWAVKEALA